MFCIYLRRRKRSSLQLFKKSLGNWSNGDLRTRGGATVFLSTTGFHPLTEVVRDGERDGLMAWVGGGGGLNLHFVEYLYRWINFERLQFKSSTRTPITHRFPGLCYLVKHDSLNNTERPNDQVNVCEGVNPSPFPSVASGPQMGKSICSWLTKAAN